MNIRGRPVVREVVDPADPAVAKGHRLLRRIFPKVELVSCVEWSHSLRERQQRLWTDLRWHLVIAEAAGRVVGVATGTYLGNVNTGIIGYVAVARSARQLGIGPRLRAKLRSRFERDAQQIRCRPLQAVVGEGRSDNPWLRALLRTARVLALDLPYFQPQPRRRERPVPLVFYYESIGRARRRLSAATIRRLLYTIWRRLYRIGRPLSDPAFQRILRGLSKRRSVGAIKRKELPAPRAP
jgi:GNAT superfamily N-acetyltransferase